MDVSCTINDRNAKPPSKIYSYWQSLRTLNNCQALFAVEVTPSQIQTANDLWRKDTSKTYIRGEEALEGWQPASTEMVSQFRQFRRSERSLAEVAATRSILLECRQDAILPAVLAAGRQEVLLAKVVQLWKRRFGTENDVSFPMLLPSSTF